MTDAADIVARSETISAAVLGIVCDTACVYPLVLHITTLASVQLRYTTFNMRELWTSGK